MTNAIDSLPFIVKFPIYFVCTAVTVGILAWVFLFVMGLVLVVFALLFGVGT